MGSEASLKMVPREGAEVASLWGNDIPEVRAPHHYIQAFTDSIFGNLLVWVPLQILQLGLQFRTIVEFSFCNNPFGTSLRKRFSKSA